MLAGGEGEKRRNRTSWNETSVMSAVAYGEDTPVFWSQNILVGAVSGGEHRGRNKDRALWDSEQQSSFATYYASRPIVHSQSCCSHRPHKCAPPLLVQNDRWSCFRRHLDLFGLIPDTVVVSTAAYPLRIGFYTPRMSIRTVRPPRLSSVSSTHGRRSQEH